MSERSASSYRRQREFGFIYNDDSICRVAKCEEKPKWVVMFREGFGISYGTYCTKHRNQAQTNRNCIGVRRLQNYAEYRRAFR